MVDWQQVTGWLLQNGIRILFITVMGIVLWFILNSFLPPLIRGAVRRNIEEDTYDEQIKREDTLIAVFRGLGRALIILVIVFSILSVLNIPIAPVLASFGIAGVAVGFGAQYLIRDLITGVFIIMENQYRVGDVIQIADVRGLVEKINLRKTVLRDLDGIVYHIPNGEIKIASNFTRNYSRVNMNISVAYDTDLDHAIRAINRVGQEIADDERWRDMIISPPSFLRVDKLGDSGIDLKILGDVKPNKQWEIMGELRLRLKNAFDTEGIEIPWPHTKIYFGNQPIPARVICPICGCSNPEDGIFCTGCGANLVNKIS